MKKSWTTYALACLIAVMLLPLGAAPGRAQKFPAPITAVIDIQKILRESTAAQSVRSQLDERRGKLRDEFAKLEDELRGAEQELARQRSVLSADAFEEKRQSYEKRVADAQRRADISRRQLDDAFQTALKEIQTAMLEVAEGVATQMNLDLVLPRSQVIFVNKDLDITDQILKGLNAKLPSVKLTAGQAGAPQGGGAEAPAAAPAPQPAPAAQPAPAPKKK
ncbi:MAG: OmpH family outer membrane protein [Alphaproteobacteria bacterium]